MESSIFVRTVEPVNPAAPYMGGKKALASQLTEMIAHIPHLTYAEPFVGMGGVFLRKQTAAKAEVINDISGDVVTLFRVLQRHYVAFMDMLRYQLTSRKEFERLMAVDPGTLTDLERAARFLYLQRLAYGGKVTGRNFGVNAAAPARFDVIKLQSQLADISERLSSVVIENLNYGEFIRRYDTPQTLFYLDPPYYNCENDYGKGVFSKADFEALAAQLVSIAGQFILSINDTPKVRDIFAAFNFEVVNLHYTVNGSSHKAVQELIITPHSLKMKPKEASLFDALSVPPF